MYIQNINILNIMFNYCNENIIIDYNYFILPDSIYSYSIKLFVIFAHKQKCKVYRSELRSTKLRTLVKF